MPTLAWPCRYPGTSHAHASVGMAPRLTGWVMKTDDLFRLMKAVADEMLPVAASLRVRVAVEWPAASPAGNRQ